MRWFDSRRELRYHVIPTAAACLYDVEVRFRDQRPNDHRWHVCDLLNSHSGPHRCDRCKRFFEATGALWIQAELPA